MPTARHRTPSEQRAHAAGRAAIARARAHLPSPAAQTEDERLAELYPYVTHARARQIRLEAQEEHHAGT